MKPKCVLFLFFALALASCEEPKTQAPKSPVYSGGPMPLREAELMADQCMIDWPASDKDEEAAQKRFRAAVIQMLADPIASGRLEATRELIDLRTSRAMDAFRLSGGAGEPDANVRAAAIEAIGKLGKSDMALAVAANLKDRSETVRLAAVNALGALRNPQTVDALIGILNNDSNPKVRCAAARALGWIRDPVAVPTLIAVLKFGSDPTRAAAAAGLGLISDIRAVPPLIAALKDTNALVRYQAANALGQLRDARASLPLSNALKDADPAVQNAARNALNQINPKR